MAMLQGQVDEARHLTEIKLITGLDFRCLLQHCQSMGYNWLHLKAIGVFFLAKISLLVRKKSYMEI